MNKPTKAEQVAAAMLLVFEKNPGVVMTRFAVEEALNLGEFSDSTKQRALNHLAYEGHIKYESHWPSPHATTYWLSAS